MDDDVPHFDRLVLLAAVAQSYYIDRASQDEIAAKYGFSRSNISRMLGEARRHGLVDIRVRHPIPTSAELESRLLAVFPSVRSVVVQPSGAADGDRELALAGWREIERVLEPNGVVGISWGRSLWAAVELARNISIPGARIVQIGGAEDAAGGDRIHNVAANLGRRLGVDVVQFPAPLLADDERAADVLLAQSSVRAVIDIALSATASVVGIGAIDDKLAGQRRSRFDSQTLKELKSAGAVGDICGYHFDADGEVIDCPQNKRVVGLGAEGFRSMARKIAIANGVRKAAAIRAAMLGGWADVVVTDAVTAEAVLAV